MLCLNFNILENKHRFDTVLKNCNENTVNAPDENKFSNAIKLLKYCHQDLDEGKHAMLDIIIEQLQLINTAKEKLRFCSLSLNLSLKIFLNFLTCYMLAIWKKIFKFAPSQ